MTKHVLILFFIWFFVPLTYGSGILVVSANQELVSGRPGEVLTLVLNLKNQTGTTQQLKPNWTLPAGWACLSDDLPFTLEAGKSTMKLLSIHISPNAKAGVFPIKYEVKALDADNVSGAMETGMEVRLMRKLLLEPAETPEYVQAGQNISATFILQNLGNAAQVFSISTENCDLEGEKDIYLEPNESVVLRVRAKTLATLSHIGRVFLKINAGLHGSEEVLAYASSFVQVVPHAQFEIQEGQQLPVSLRLSHLTRKFSDGESISGFQGELYTNGSLDEAGENQVEMRLRGPDRFGLSQLGQYDEYFARFENKKYYAFVGDKTYSLTPLTEFARYGRGVEASVKFDGYEMGGYYQRPRFFPEVAEVTAGYLRQHFDQNNQLGLNVMRKIYTEGRGDAVLASVHGNFQPLPNTSVEAELSTGQHIGDWGNSALLRVNSQPIQKLYLSTGVIYADKNYPGFFTNTTSYYAQADYQLAPALNVSLLLNQDERNASRDTLFAVSPYSRLSQAGVSYQFKNQISLRGYIRHNELKDRMPTLKFHYKEDALRLQTVKDWQHFQVSLTGEIGKRENLLNQPEDRFSMAYRSFFNLSYRLQQRHSVEGFAQYFRYDQFSGTTSRQWIFGGSVNSQLTPSTRMRLSFQTNYLLEEYHRNRNLLDFRFAQQVGKRKNHELSIAANYVLLQRTQQDRDMSVQVNYTWNFGLRTASKKESQSLLGQLTNEGVKSVEGLVLHLNGQSAETGPDGRFSFKNIPPGTYYLMLDPASVSLHDISDTPMPIQVTVEPGVDAWVDFGLTRSTTLTGKVDIEPEKKPTRFNGKDDRPKVFMFEITNGKETFRRLSNENYRFEFPDIRPGTWQVRILNPDSYQGFYFERTEWELELLPGMTKELDVHFLRKKKEIKFQEKLSLTSAGD